MSARFGRPARLWALAGVALLLLEATWKLGSRGVTTVRAGLDPAEWLALLLLTATFLYGEGVRALQRRWVPRVLQRSAELEHGAPRRWKLLAPLYALSLVGAPPRTLLRAWAGVLAIVLAVALVRQLPQPWRGIVDLAVAVALAWGLGALLLRAARDQGATS